VSTTFSMYEWPFVEALFYQYSPNAYCLIVIEFQLRSIMVKQLTGNFLP